MNKTRSRLLLLGGFVAGWVVASAIAHRTVTKIKSGWTPEVQKFVTEYAEFAKLLTKEDLEQMRRDMRDYSRQVLKEVEYQTLYDALLATHIKAFLEKGDTNGVQELLTRKLANFQEAHAKGRYKGKDGERLADVLVSGITSTTNSPTNASVTFPRELGK